MDGNLATLLVPLLQEFSALVKLFCEDLYDVSVIEEFPVCSSAKSFTNTICFVSHISYLTPMNELKPSVKIWFCNFGNYRQLALLDWLHPALLSGKLRLWCSISVDTGNPPYSWCANWVTAIGIYRGLCWIVIFQGFIICFLAIKLEFVSSD